MQEHVQPGCVSPGKALGLSVSSQEARTSHSNDGNSHMIIAHNTMI